MRKISPRERPTPSEISAMLSGLWALARSSRISNPLSSAGARYLGTWVGMTLLSFGGQLAASRATLPLIMPGHPANLLQRVL